MKRRVLGIVGWSGAGKTTLLVRLIPELVGRGLKISTVKHTHHDFDIDRTGKDSYRHREAGAGEVLVASERRWALMHELRGAAEPSLDTLIGHMSPCDLLLVEGFKHHPHPKLEVHRPANGKPLLHPNDSTIVAVASDVALADCALPVLDLGNERAIADFILSLQEIPS
ncbi:MAG: molybdopterin-guanine dinucleotide biosynthesis protein B [Magnetospirillum sp. WYHS-4]